MDSLQRYWLVTLRQQTSLDFRQWVSGSLDIIQIHDNDDVIHTNDDDNNSIISLPQQPNPVTLPSHGQLSKVLVGHSGTANQLGL